MSAHPRRAWWKPVAVGLLAVAVFFVLIAVSSTLRHNWAFLVLSAVAVAALVLVLPPVTERRPTLPWLPPEDRDLTEPSEPAALRTSAVTVSKVSADDGENEDAYAIGAGTGYVAIADGASSSFQAADWARTLCDTFLARRPLQGRPSTAWIAEAAAAFAQVADPGSAWWSMEAAQRGAHAAFAGLAVAHTGQGLGWRALAIGDCVLVHLRQDPRRSIITSFPIAHSASFPQSPPLLSSVTDGYPPVASIDGVASMGDVWLLMTDELARWALRRHEGGEPVWEDLASGSDADVRVLIKKARADDGVADDDMTIVRCEAVPAN